MCYVIMCSSDLDSVRLFWKERVSFDSYLYAQMFSLCVGNKENMFCFPVITVWCLFWNLVLHLVFYLESFTQALTRVTVKKSMSSRNLMKGWYSLIKISHPQFSGECLLGLFHQTNLVFIIHSCCLLPWGKNKKINNKKSKNHLISISNGQETQTVHFVLKTLCVCVCVFVCRSVWCCVWVVFSGIVLCVCIDYHI